MSAGGPQPDKQPYYILTGSITPEVVAQAILWIHGQLWNGAQKIRFILSSTLILQSDCMIISRRWPSRLRW